MKEILFQIQIFTRMHGRGRDHFCQQLNPQKTEFNRLITSR